jgi:hypothetical protein
MYRLLIFAALVSALGYAAEPKEPPICRFLKGGTQLKQDIGGFRLILTQIQSARNDDGCKARLLAPDGKVLWRGRAWAYSLPVAPVDINNDDNPDLVLEEYTGGAHCCWVYYIFSTKSTPALVLTLPNERDAGFSKRWRGKRIIATLGGEFDYFHTSHAASFFPPVYLLLEDRKLIDISGAPEFRAEYDALIKEAYEQLQKIDSNRQWKDASNEPNEDIRSNTLQIVLSYLYSRRPHRAWKALSELWPEYDVTRMKKEILDTRKTGVLKHASPLTEGM